MSRLTEANEIFVPRYQVMQDILAQHERAHWLADEAEMTGDVAQWKNGTVSTEEKEYIKMILRLFTQADHNVCGGYVEKLLPIFKQADARMMLLSFASREASAHVLGYKRLNDTLGYDSEEFMSEFLSYEEMAAKHAFMIGKADLSSKKGIAEYVAKQMLIEGVNLFASFAMLLNFSREGKLPGMVSVNSWSCIDENIHCEGLAAIFNIFVNENKIDKKEIIKAVQDTAKYVVSLEHAFIALCFNIHTPSNLTKEDLKGYIEYIANHRLEQLGIPTVFDAHSHNLDWIDAAMGNKLTNFFEVKVTEYSKNNMSGEWEY